MDASFNNTLYNSVTFIGKPGHISVHCDFIIFIYYPEIFQFLI